MDREGVAQEGEINPSWDPSKTEILKVTLQIWSYYLSYNIVATSYSIFLYFIYMLSLHVFLKIIFFSQTMWLVADRLGVLWERSGGVAAMALCSVLRWFAVLWSWLTWSLNLHLLLRFTAWQKTEEMGALQKNILGTSLGVILLVAFKTFLKMKTSQVP